MYTQLIAALTLAGAANALAVKPRQSTTCNKFPANTITMIQNVQIDAITVIADIAQNSSHATGEAHLSTFTNSFNNLFPALNGPQGTLETVCKVNVPTLEQAQAEAQESGVRPTPGLREQQEQALQSQVLLPLQKVTQDVASCEQAEAVAEYCKIAQWFYQAPPKPAASASVH